MERKFSIISSGFNSEGKMITTIAHVDRVKALQDGEWKEIAFPEMVAQCHVTITEDVVKR